jgi:hypothetical protein
VVSEFQSPAKKAGRRPASNAQTPAPPPWLKNQAAGRKNECRASRRRYKVRAYAAPGGPSQLPAQ